MLEPSLAAWFASIGGIAAHVASGAEIDDLYGGYARWFAKHGVEVALVRPDFAVFGAARTLDGASELVQVLRRRLKEPRS